MLPIYWKSRLRNGFGGAAIAVFTAGIVVFSPAARAAGYQKTSAVIFNRSDCGVGLDLAGENGFSEKIYLPGGASHRLTVRGNVYITGTASCRRGSSVDRFSIGKHGVSIGPHSDYDIYVDRYSTSLFSISVRLLNAH